MYILLLDISDGQNILNSDRCIKELCCFLMKEKNFDFCLIEFKV